MVRVAEGATADVKLIHLVVLAVVIMDAPAREEVLADTLRVELSGAIEM
ncbi:MAG: hypothetical protein ACK4YV_11615 [Emticicia sp.]